MGKKYCHSRSYVMNTLCDIYIIENIDVFNYQANHDNYITYHHLIKEEELKLLGFPTTKTIENGLVLTTVAHSYLHLIETFAPDIFYHLNKIIMLFTLEKRLPTIEERSLMQILLECFEYRMSEYYVISQKYLKRVPLGGNNENNK